jgi:hypothetical protein
MHDGFTTRFQTPTDEVYSICSAPASRVGSQLRVSRHALECHRRLLHVPAPRPEFCGMVSSPRRVVDRAPQSREAPKGFEIAPLVWARHRRLLDPRQDDDYAFDITLSTASTRPVVTADRAQDFACRWVSVLGLRELMLGGRSGLVVHYQDNRRPRGRPRPIEPDRLLHGSEVRASGRHSLSPSRDERSSCPDWTETRPPFSPSA